MTEPKTVVTISRMYGSGGREVGEQLAEALGLTYYDKELIARAAQESGLDEELVEKAGESTASPLSYLFSYASGTSSVSEDTLPLSDRVYIAQSRIIKQIAREGGCVIVGRCSDYVLEGEVRAINVLIRADWDARVSRVMTRNQLDQAAAVERIKKTDKRRASYYQHYTGRKWADANNYDIAISTTTIGIGGTVELLKRYVELFNSAAD
ncbi:MAG: cytidylate kinase-like family protein [Coriobacteriales bacterium]|nr:cytidylate kinase-like family protein [Coriobacteriales bacterium]